MNTTSTTAYRSNILGATGLPKTILAAMFRRDGLFGRDSSLARDEQAVLQSRLPAIRGLAAPAAIKPFMPRLSVLADLADALIGGADASSERERAVRAGLDADAVQEVQTVIGNVFAVFGPFPAKAQTVPGNGSNQVLAAAA